LVQAAMVSSMDDQSEDPPFRRDAARRFAARKTTLVGG
jgi:hypothetical protein